MIDRRLAVLGLGAIAMAGKARADLYDDYINSKSKQPFVAFFARDDTLTGHAFVAVGIELDNGLTVYEGIYGFYPAGGTKQVMKFRQSGKGIITFKDNDYPSAIRFRQNVDDATKQKALAVFDIWRSEDTKYNLLAHDGKNCNSLARDVAGAIGLKRPPEDPGLTLPATYIRRLREVNSQR